MKKAIIITSYMEYSINFNYSANTSDYIICTDGGYDIALEHGIHPDLLLGDFDSVKSSLPEDIETVRFNPEKDFTDLDLALKYSYESGIDTVEIWGGIGGRLDHTIANIQLLSSYCNKFKKLSMLDGRNKCFCITANSLEKVTVPYENDCYISLFALSDEVNVSASGVKYPLNNHSLKRIFPLGVSNEFTSDNAQISIENGTLLIVLSKNK